MKTLEGQKTIVVDYVGRSSSSFINKLVLISRNNTYSFSHYFIPPPKKHQEKQ